MKRMLITGAACLIAAALPGRDAPEWLSRGIVAPVPAGETAKIPLLAKRGVTIVYVTNGTNDAFVAASAAVFLYIVLALDVSGSMEGTQRAISVLPEPGGPTMSTLCPPAAAMVSARFALFCPLTFTKSDEYTLSPSNWR